jgi:aflatoxin B1 aldehyde reductase
MGSVYAGMYGKPSYLEALSEWEQIANEVGCSRAELAYRWVSYNSPLDPKHGDAIIVGASSLQQLEQTIAGLKNGKLPESAAKKIDALWKKIEPEAPLDNYHR